MLNLQVEVSLELYNLGPGTRDVTLTQLLPRFRHREATDLRDKVYALLPLVTDWFGAEPLVPDYTKRVGEVYIETIVKVIRDSRSLDVLCRPPEMEEEKRMEGLPSWVMDLSQPAAAGATLDRLKGMLPLYNACGGLRVQGMEVYEGVGGGKVLAMEGVRVDVLKRASTIAVGMSESSMRDTVKWWCGVAEEEIGERDGEWKGKFARTICGDAMVVPGIGGRAAGFRRATEEDIRRVDAYVKEIWESSSTPPDDDGQAGAVGHAVKVATQMRAFVISRHDRMGLVPNTARMTFPRPDEIFIFPGAKAPVVLRDVGVRDITGIGPQVCYTFLGECYLHGVMDGEGKGTIWEAKQMVYLI